MNRAAQISCVAYSPMGWTTPVEEKLQECETSHPEPWDHELEEDIKADRLFRLINRALRELEEAETTPLAAMSHLASHDFWRCVTGLPAEAQELAEKTFAKIKSNPQDRSLHFTKIACCWLVCIGAHHRALAVQVARRLVWFWIGNYSDYTALVRREASVPRL